MVAVLGDTAHVEVQRERYAARRARLRPALEAAGFTIDHSEAGLYLWATRGEDSRATLAWLAERGILVAPGDFYGAAAARSSASRSPRRTSGSTPRWNGSGRAADRSEPPPESVLVDAGQRTVTRTVRPASPACTQVGQVDLVGRPHPVVDLDRDHPVAARRSRPRTARRPRRAAGVLGLHGHDLARRRRRPARKVVVQRRRQPLGVAVGLAVDQAGEGARRSGRSARWPAPGRRPRGRA